ncbi:MAG: single-stranded-DNA-specific exonuclease RecJ [Chloroflexi bacterium]|nr:single-stranded-DNA-specific exonuclease RecJ [Chloroflexota bacterium]
MPGCGQAFGGVTGRRWAITPEPEPEALSRLNGAVSGTTSRVSQLGARLLYNRGIRDAEEARIFLNPELSQLGDPFALPDMERAVDRVFQAIGNREKIAVFGDFDVDGLSATALLLHALRDLGGTVVAHIPGRDGTGHGLNNDALGRLAADGVSLILTVDTGSNDTDEIAFAASIGVDVIVTDHHIVETRPQRVLALVNPHLSSNGAGDGLTGAGVAFKLAQALYLRASRNWPSHVIALAALGTVADVGPLKGENRVIVWEGLRQLAQTSHAGLSALLARAHPNGGDLDTEALSFNVIPRLNAPGRLGEAGPSLNLLTADDPAEALMLAQQVDEMNTERRRLSQEAWDTASAELAGAGGNGTLPAALIVRSTGFRTGILGPLAGRLCGEHGRPAIAIAIGETHSRASVRSTDAFDAHAALLTVADLFEQWGGHARAAGFTVRNEHLSEVLDAFLEQAAKAATTPENTPPIRADAEIGFSDLGRDTWDFVKALGPFGEENPTPVFVTRNLSPGQVRTMGAGGRHLRLTLEDGRGTWNAIGFGLGKAPLGGGAVDAIYSLRTNVWRGRTRQELHLLDIRPSG